jgi:cupin fold WbuC family metalloprotein
MTTRLDNPEYWMIDDKGRSLAYFSKNIPCIVDREMIEYLKEASIIRGRVNARLCLHTSPKEELHSMVIIEYQNKKCLRPHKHLNVDEVIGVIEGELLSLTFDEGGILIDKTSLKEGTIYKNKRGLYHLYIPTRDYSIYNETKNGPFKHEDCLFPKWDHKKMLEEQIKFMDIRCDNIECKHKCSLYRI